MAEVVVVAPHPKCNLHGTPWMDQQDRRSWRCLYTFRHPELRPPDRKVCGIIVRTFFTFIRTPS